MPIEGKPVRPLADKLFSDRNVLDGVGEVTLLVVAVNAPWRMTLFRVSVRALCIFLK